VEAVIAIVFKFPPPAAKAKAVFPWSASPARLAAAFQSMLYDVGLLAVAVYGKVAICADALKHNALIVPVVVIVGKGFIKMVTAWLDVHPLPFFMVIVPEYVPPGVLAVITIVFKLPPPAANTNAVFPWSASPAVLAAAFQSILYDVGLLAVAVYGNVTFCANELAHIVLIVPVVVIVGNGLIIMVTALLFVHPFPFVIVMVPEYEPPGVLAVITIVFKLPPPAAKAKAVFPWSASPAVLAAASQSTLYDVGLFAVAVYGNVAVCADELEHNAFIVPVVVIVGKGLIVIVTACAEVHAEAFVKVMVPE